MTDFKVGDEIWWFEGPDQNIFLHSIELQLKMRKVEEVNKEHFWLGDMGIIRNSNFYFRTKAEAINAMIKRLEELKSD